MYRVKTLGVGGIGISFERKADSPITAQVVEERLKPSPSGTWMVGWTGRKFRCGHREDER
jgi:hypothetical protein